MTASPFARLMGPASIWWLIALLVVATLIFRRFPALDIETARLFTDENGFSLAYDATLRAIRRASINLTKILVPTLLLLWIYRLLRPQRNERISFAKIAFPTAALLAGPVLITNLILKENWGRPRPRALEEFGGDAHFILPWDLSDQCASNCSFVAGETSSAIWLLTLIPLLPLAWHARALWVIAAYTLVISGLRIAFGGHFLSDVAFSILLNLMAFWLTWGLFFKRTARISEQDWANETRREGAFRTWGGPLRTLIRKASLVSRALMDKVRQP
ncbi:MAG: phosphatase PAP2 family protein [Pseudomonadota bacterium]